MRGYRVGVGDIDEVSGWTKLERHQARGNDNWTKRRQHDSGMVRQYGRNEQHATGQQGWHRLCISHSARCEHGAIVIYGAGFSGTDRMRGNRVGVRDLGEVSGGSQVAEHLQDCHVHVGACRQRITGLVSG